MSFKLPIQGLDLNRDELDLHWLYLDLDIILLYPEFDLGFIRSFFYQPVICLIKLILYLKEIGFSKHNAVVKFILIYIMF